jgi:hypothetical protein
MSLLKLTGLAGILAVTLAFTGRAAAPGATLTVDVGHFCHAVSPTLHGIFFEDINDGADGGLYAELVQNRSFEHAEHLYAWATVDRDGQGTVTVESADPLNPKNLHDLRISVQDAIDLIEFANGPDAARSPFER